MLEKNKTKLYFIVGPVGAGKSTYSAKLAADTGAIIFSNDEWMVNLYAKDTPLIPSLNWLLTRIDRCENQMWKLIPKLLERDIPVVLDFGGLSKARRTQVIARCEQELGRRPEVIYLFADVETRRLRVVERNKGESPTYSFKVSGWRFKWAEKRFEAPTPQEIPGLRVVETETLQRVGAN